MKLFFFRRRHRLSILKSVIFICVLLFISLSLLTQQLHPSLIIRDMGYLTRPIWDKPGAQPEILIPHFHSDAVPPAELCSLHGWTPRDAKKRKPKIFDAVIFSIELDLLEIRIRELWDVVDTFLVLEADRTFTGKSKPLFLQQNLHRFEWAKEKLIPINLTNILAEIPAKDFDNEVLMRKKMHAAILSQHPVEGDLIIASDVDEIPFQSTIQLLAACEGWPSVIHLQMRNYVYSFEFYVDTTNWKPHINVYNSQFGYHHGKSKNSNYTLADSGWHCSFCFRYLSDFKFKMTSYSHSDRALGQDHLLDLDNIQRKICDGSNIYDMYPEAYSYRELFAFMGNVPKTHSTMGIPNSVLLDVQKFRFLLPGGCVREDASEKWVQNAQG